MKKAIAVLVLGLVVLGLSGFTPIGGPCRFFNPVKVAIFFLDMKLDLSDAQKTEIKGILEPFVSEMRAAHKKALDKPEEMIEKIRSGKLEKTDITAHMAKRRELAAAQQEKIAEVILKVYQILTPEQRENLASTIKDHMRRFTD